MFRKAGCPDPLDPDQLREWSAALALVNAFSVKPNLSERSGWSRVPGRFPMDINDADLINGAEYADLILDAHFPVQSRKLATLATPREWIEEVLGPQSIELTLIDVLEGTSPVERSLFLQTAIDIRLPPCR